MLPQIIFLVLLSLGIGLKIKQKGTKETQNTHSTVFGIFLVQLLYYWGGFWDKGEWPQLAMGCIIAISLVYSIIEHNTKKIKRGFTPAGVIGTCVMITILYFGHFFDPLIKFFQ